MTTRKELETRADELLVAAFDGTITTLADPAAPPTSKTTATTNAIRLYEILKGDSPTDKDPSEMTHDELMASIKALKVTLTGSNVLD